MITHSYARKYINSSKISFCLVQIQFIQFIPKTLNFQNLNVQAKPDKLQPVRDALGI
jgi:hypothetical protein